jgi:hypothetical protein
VPIVKKRKHAEEEEDPPYEEEVSASEDDDSNPEEEVVEEEEEEVGDESDEPSSYEEELPSTSKSLKEHVVELKRKKVVKRKPAQVPDKKQAPSPSKKPKEATPTQAPARIVKKVKKKVQVVDENKKSSNMSVEYNDKNVDYNLYNEAPEHIKNLKIKISSNVIMLCRMIEATGNTSQGLTYDYAALSFVRQSKNGKAYEFNLPLNLAPSIVKGITLLIKQNPKFFDKHLLQPAVPEEIE